MGGGVPNGQELDLVHFFLSVNSRLIFLTPFKSIILALITIVLILPVLSMNAAHLNSSLPPFWVTYDF